MTTKTTTTMMIIILRVVNDVSLVTTRIIDGWKTRRPYVVWWSGFQPITWI